MRQSVPSRNLCILGPNRESNSARPNFNECLQPGKRRVVWGSGGGCDAPQRTLLGDHHLLDHPSHGPEGGDGFTAETAETAEENAEKPESESGFRPPDPADPLSWLCPHLCGLCDLCGEPRVSITTVAAVRPVGPRWGSDRREVSIFPARPLTRPAHRYTVLAGSYT